MFKKISTIFILGFLSTTIITWPFITKLSSYYSDWGDYPLNGWLLWYTEQSIVTGRIFNQDQYFQSFQMYPLPLTLAYSDHLFVPSLIFTLIYFPTNNLIFSLNFFIFLTFVLSFISAFYFIKFFLEELNKNYSANQHKNLTTVIYLTSTIGAFVYTFNPLTSIQFSGHLQLMHKYFLPPLFIFAYKYLKEINARSAFLFFLFFTLNALSSIYFFVFSIILLPLFFIPFVTKFIKQKSWNKLFKLFKLSLISLFFLPLILYFNIPYLNFSQKENVSRSLEETAHFSARLIDWFSPNPNSVIYKQYADTILASRKPKEGNGDFNITEHTLTLNYFPYFISLLIFIFIIRNRKKVFIVVKNSQLIQGFLLVLIGSFIIAFGPFFMGWNATDSNLQLPYYYLYKLLPILSAIRVPTRVEFFFYIPFSLFISYFVFSILKTQKTKNCLILFFGILILLIAENISFNKFLETSYVLSNYFINKPNLQFLKNKNTVHFPVQLNDIASEVKYLNWQTQTGEKILNGYSGYTPNDWFQLVTPLSLGLSKTLIPDSSIKELAALDIDYLVFHKNINADFSLRKYFPTKLVYEDDYVFIEEIPENYRNQFKCSNRSLDIKIEPILGIANNHSPLSITVKNPQNCYYPSVGFDRYRKVNFEINNKKYQTNVKLPLVLRPNEERIIIGYPDNF